MKPIYHLNCEKCGTQFLSKEAFPEYLLCEECYNKRLIEVRHKLAEYKTMRNILIEELEKSLGIE